MSRCRFARISGALAALGILLSAGLPLFALGHRPPEVPDIRDCLVVDKPYRSIAVLPAFNKSKLKEFDFMSSALSLFIADDLKNMDTVTISTLEIERPMLTNRRSCLSPSDRSNLRRRLVVVAPASNFALLTPQGPTNVDYLVKETYGRRTNDIWWFRIDLVSQRMGPLLSYTQTADLRTVLDRVPFLTERLKRFLLAGHAGYGSTGRDTSDAGRKPDPVSGRMIQLLCDQELTSVKAINRDDPWTADASGSGHDGSGYGGAANGRPGVTARFLGYAPVHYFLTTDGQVFSFEKEGYRTVFTNIGFSSAASTYEISLREAVDRYRLKVRTVPPGAAVYLNEVFLGLSPVDKVLLPANAAVLSVAVSNRPVFLRRISLDRDRAFSFNMADRARPDKGLFSYRNLTWASFIAGVAVIGYGVWNLAEAERQRRISVAHRTGDPAVLENRGYWIFAGSIPFFSLTVWFGVKHSDSKDW